VKNLANIIQARMSEIMDFVTYHLKQVGLDNRALNGGIVMTGGGSQLRHLIQLTEYVTGLNARIGYPTEHLAAGHIEELAKPTYSTCIGLILKGYSDYEHNRKQFDKGFRRMEVPDNLRKAGVQEEEEEIRTAQDRELLQQEKVRNRKGMKDFWGKFKDGIIDLFKEEEDHAL
jgi:cell division protein FtsA